MARSTPRGAWLWLAAALVAAPLTAQVGTEIWFGWPRTADVTLDDPSYDLDGELVILAAHEPARVQVRGPGIDTVVEAAPGAPATIRLPREMAMVVEEDTAVARGYHLQSEDCTPFGALFRVPGSGASVGDDVMRLLPVSMLGTTYRAVSYYGESELLVVATRDETTVEIEDEVCGSPPPTVMQRGEVLLHRCVDDPNDGSVTGALVRASAPVALHVGSARSQVVHHFVGPSVEFFWSFADILLESLWPVDLTGTRQVHLPFRRESAEAVGDLLRVVAACPDTRLEVVEADGDAWSEPLAEAGDHVDLEEWDFLAQEGRMVAEAATLDADRPVVVGAFTGGQGGAGAPGIGDPSLSVLDPIERWGRAVRLWLPEGYQHSLGIVTSAGAGGDVVLDGTAVSGAWQPVGDGSRFEGLRLDDVPPGEHLVAGAGEPIFVQVSGYLPDGDAGAVSYPGLALPEPGGPAEARIEGPDPCLVLCPGGCVELRVPEGATDVEWSDGAGTATTTWCPTETLEVAANFRVDGCPRRASRTLPVAGGLPTLAVEGPSEVCLGRCVELAATSGYDAYLWDGGQTSRTVETCPAASETHSVSVEDEASGCRATASHTIEVYPPPVVGPAAAEVDGLCGNRVRVSWPEATWRPGSSGGTYHLYRREGACAPPDDPSWSLVASDLDRLDWTDPGLEAGRRYSWLLVAEDEPAEEACAPGPNGGPTAAVCASPASLEVPGDPDAPLLVDLSPWLRAEGYRKRFGPDRIEVDFEWAGAPGLDPRTLFEVRRSDRPADLALQEEDLPDPRWTDPEAAESDLLFYRMVNTTECGTRWND